MSRSALGLSLVFFFLAQLVGCGGGGGGGGVVTTPVTYSISWGARSRIDGPSSALSAVLTITGGDASGGDFVTQVNRVSAPPPYTQTYTSANACRLGTRLMAIRFYAGANGSGAVVAIGQASVTIQADGSGIGNVTVTNTVATVAVDAGQSVQETETQQLTFTARDSQNAIVAVSPGSAIWTQVNGGSKMTLTQDGIATGVQVGSSDVTATVDGVVSPAVAINVTVYTTPITYSLHWGARSRHGGPNSALSAVLTITGGNPDGQDFVTQVNRHADTAGYDETYVSANECKTGTFQLTIRFYALPNGAGDMVASGQATVTIQQDGTGIGDVTIANVVMTASVVAGQTLAVSQVKQLTFTARDANGAIVAVTPGSAFWIQQDGGAFMSITQDGIATGLQPGTSNVFITIDTVFGQPASVTITP